MPFLLLACLSIYAIQPTYTEQVESFNCTLPPQPKNGQYRFYNQDQYVNNTLRPGDKLKSFMIEILCDPGYVAIESVHHSCLEDGTTVNENFECLPLCVHELNNVISCSASTRCVSQSDIASIGGSGLSDYDFVGCGFTGPIKAAYVSGGRSAEKEELPWHAAIYTKTTKPYMQICGGSIVSTKVVISAAHCFWSEIKKQLPASKYAVAAGKLYRPWNDPMDNPHVQKSNVAEIMIPPYFQGSTTNLQDDIALVIVTDAFVFKNGVRPVCLEFNVELDKKQLTPGSLGKVAGWGLTSEDGPASPVLKIVNLPVVDIKQCFEQSEATFRTHITGDKICAGYRNGTAVCKGDSGGGLSFLNKDRIPRRYYLRGVVSGAPRNEHLCNTYAWASFTHLLKHEHFIRETVPESIPTGSDPAAWSVETPVQDTAFTPLHDIPTFLKTTQQPEYKQKVGYF